MTEAGVYYPPETRVLPLTTIRRERMLPMPGKVLVNPGDRVQPAQPVAQAEVSGEVSVVNVAHLLRVPPAFLQQPADQTGQPGRMEILDC